MLAGRRVVAGRHNTGRCASPFVSINFGRHCIAIFLTRRNLTTACTRPRGRCSSSSLAGPPRRVMPGVRPLRFLKTLTETCRCQRRAALYPQAPASRTGAALRITIGGAWREGRGSEFRRPRPARIVSAAHPNNGMHPTPPKRASHGRCLGARVMPGVRCFR
jgi:hypothetical protein